MIKLKRKRKSNQGNSFIVVVATISFLAVLVTALLVAVALCFRMKAYDINSRDNFYYLEQAMDEIYEGVGEISMKHLNAAYDETSEVIVYFDSVSKTYMTMKNADANKLMKNTFLHKLTEDSKLQYANIVDTLNGMISNQYSSSVPEGVKISVGNVALEGDVLTIKDVILSREAEYSTVNAKKNGDKRAATTFVQSITTDLTISVPDFNIDFDSVGNDISELYDFVMISDMGVEVNGISTNSSIIGNVYAAADFYNKEYNSNASTGKVEEETDDTRTKPLANRVNSYSDDELKKCDGVSEKSMYSGFYVNGAKVTIMADKLIVPGSLASMNCANLNVVGSIKDGGASPTKVWADGIILGGYSRKKVGTDSYRGSNLKMKADSYVYDDLEVNAAGSGFALDGTYYGYNYASTDNRKYSDDFIEASTNRKFLKDKDGKSIVKINDGNYIGEDGEGNRLVGQAHYNSSSVVVNGSDSTLDLSNVNTMYIAGQAYVEMSKATTSNEYVATEADNKLTLTPVTPTTPDDGSVERVTKDTYSYEEKSDENYSMDKDGNKTRIQDYRTGEGLSVKSNQLAYIPPYNVKEDPTDGSLYVIWPESIRTADYFKDMWDDLSKVPVIKTVISGSEYYFYDFSQAKDAVTMNKYMEEYTKLFDLAAGETHTKGDLANFYDITDYDEFKVNLVNVDVSKIYSNSAISVKKGDKVTIKADSKSVAPLLEAKKALDKKLQDDVPDDSVAGSNPQQYSQKITKGLQKEYKEMKMLLTSDSTNAVAVENAYTADEGNITPINYYFNFEGLNGITETKDRGKIKAKNKMKSGYIVFLGEANVNVSADTPDGRVKGIVICKGDVTFDSNVKEFEGLIVAGGKIKVEHSIDFVANAEIIKSVLRECDESKRLGGEDLSGICSLFRHYVPSEFSTSTTPDSNVESMKSITAVQYEDILAFKNWKKNVD
ncbi:MAG: hypothetical protein PUC12_12795 [Clostridiales bacterium]|nr:hypothetical protein [Clostridiales bacterium]